MHGRIVRLKPAPPAPARYATVSEGPGLVCLHAPLPGTEKSPRIGRDAEGAYRLVECVCRYCGRTVRLMERAS
jgi:hypothetical protein